MAFLEVREYSNKVRELVLSLKIVEVTGSGSNMKIIVQALVD